MQDKCLPAEPPFRMKLGGAVCQVVLCKAYLKADFVEDTFTVLTIYLDFGHPHALVVCFRYTVNINGIRSMYFSFVNVVHGYVR
jgi:hypothetical protein